MDLELMAHADYFVGSSTSGIPSVIATLRMSVYDKPQVPHPTYLMRKGAILISFKGVILPGQMR